ncbi:MAG: type II toxin-antitoxin system RelE/ParE family toxin [Phycisphaerales bacterium]
MRTVELARAAIADIEAIQTYFVIEVGRPDLAERFEQALRQTLKELVRTPLIGSAWPTTQPRLRPLRRWFVDGFPNLMIFYVFEKNRLVVLAVLHGAVDLPANSKDGIDRRHQGLIGLMASAGQQSAGPAHWAKCEFDR